MRNLKMLAILIAVALVVWFIVGGLGTMGILK